MVNKLMTMVNNEIVTVTGWCRSSWGGGQASPLNQRSRYHMSNTTYYLMMIDNFHNGWWVVDNECLLITISNSYFLMNKITINRCWPMNFINYTSDTLNNTFPTFPILMVIYDYQTDSKFPKLATPKISNRSEISGRCRGQGSISPQPGPEWWKGPLWRQVAGGWFLAVCLAGGADSAFELVQMILDDPESTLQMNFKWIIWRGGNQQPAIMVEPSCLHCQNEFQLSPIIMP